MHIKWLIFKVKIVFILIKFNVCVFFYLGFHWWGSNLFLWLLYKIHICSILQIRNVFFYLRIELASSTLLRLRPIFVSFHKNQFIILQFFYYSFSSPRLQYICHCCFKELGISYQLILIFIEFFSGIIITQWSSLFTGLKRLLLFKHFTL